MNGRTETFFPNRLTRSKDRKVIHRIWPTSIFRKRIPRFHPSLCATIFLFSPFPSLPPERNLACRQYNAEHRWECKRVAVDGGWSQGTFFDAGSAAWRGWQLGDAAEFGAGRNIKERHTWSRDFHLSPSLVSRRSLAVPPIPEIHRWPPPYCPPSTKIGFVSLHAPEAIHADVQNWLHEKRSFVIQERKIELALLQNAYFRLFHLFPMLYVSLLQ